jgi:hypothetical protein
MTGPQRIQLRRARGWRMPENTVKVDRTTPWGNPFVVGRHGNAAYCVQLLEYLLAGLVCVSTDNVDEQRTYLAHAIAHRHELRGKNLACWCRPDRPCHADLLLRLARQPERAA